MLAFFERSKLPDFFSCILQILGHLYKKKTKHSLRYKKEKVELNGTGIIVNCLGHCDTSQCFFYGLDGLALHIVMAGVPPTAIATGHTRQWRQSALGSVILVWCVLLWLLVVLGTLQGERTPTGPISRYNTYGPLSNPFCTEHQV